MREKLSPEAPAGFARRNFLPLLQLVQGQEQRAARAHEVEAYVAEVVPGEVWQHLPGDLVVHEERRVLAERPPPQPFHGVADPAGPRTAPQAPVLRRILPGIRRWARLHLGLGGQAGEIC